MTASGDLLIASRRDLAELLGSPRLSPGTLKVLEGLDASTIARLSGDSAMLALPREALVDPEGIGSTAGGHTDADSAVAALATRRVATLHVVRAVDEDPLRSVLEQERLFRRRMLDVSDVDVIRDVTWRQILVFLRPIQRGELQTIEEFIRPLEASREQRVGSICRAYVLDARLRATSRHELLEAGVVWPNLVGGLIQLIRARRLEAVPDSVRLIAWRSMEIGPSIPDGEFQAAFRRHFLHPEEAREPSAKELAELPEVPSRWVGHEGVIDDVLTESDSTEPDGTLEFRPRGWIEGARERQASRRLPDAEAAAARRGVVGRRWRGRVRSVLAGVDATCTSWEEKAWELVTRHPGNLHYFSTVDTGRERVVEDVNGQQKSWTSLWETIERQDRARVELLVAAGVLDELHRHFVTWAGRLVLGGLAALVMIHVVFVVIAPLVSMAGPLPWWIWLGGAAAVVGPFAACLWTHQVESGIGKELAERLESRVASLQAEDVTRDALQIMKAGQEVGDEQSAMFARQSVRGLAGRAKGSMQIGAEGIRAIAQPVGRAGDAGSAPPTPRNPAQIEALERDSVLPTHGTDDPDVRNEVLLHGVKQHGETVRGLLETGWSELCASNDREKRGRLPSSTIRDGWKDLVAECAREMRRLVIKGIAVRGDRVVGGSIDEASKSAVDSWLARGGGQDSERRPCLSCRIGVDDLARRRDAPETGEEPGFVFIKPAESEAIRSLIEGVAADFGKGEMQELDGPLGYVFEEVPFDGAEYPRDRGGEGS